MKVLQFPLTKITIGFVLGLLLAHYFDLPLGMISGILLVLLIKLGIAQYSRQKNNTISRSSDVIICIISIGLGISTQMVNNTSFQKDHYIQNTEPFEKPRLISVTIREKLKSSVYSDRYLALVNTIDNQHQKGKVIVNIYKSASNRVFEVGNIILVRGSLIKNLPPKNPNQFDYSNYLKNKQIYAQLYTDLSSVQISPSITKDIWYYTAKLRTIIVENLKKNNFNPTELNVAIALILGQQQDISPDIIRDYQYAGAVHILSVSGLHIGFILIFLTFILKPIPNTKKGSFIKLVIILASLALFGIVAGLAPSVVRSVTMFSFVAIGNHLRRSVNIYHTLLVSILLILLFEPSFLFDVGFQLSYVALFFIISLQPLLSSIWQPKTKFTKSIWDILTVSFAAQIGTLPLSIYYFHQFPGLFFVTNLVIIPLLSITMLLGVVVMLLAALNIIPIFLSKLLEWNIYLLNKIINTIASSEQFIVQDIPLHFYIMTSSYLLLFAVVFWFKKPSYNRLKGAFYAVIILQISLLTIHRKITKETELIVFHSNKTTLITERLGKSIIVYSHNQLEQHKVATSHLKSYAINNYSNISGEKKLKNFLFFKGKTIFVLDSTCVYNTENKPDILILTQSAKINLDRLLLTLKPKLVISDGSNYKNIQQLWKASCRKRKIPFHATHEKGFYTLK